MRRTIVLFQYPQALPDIRQWEKNLGDKILRADWSHPRYPQFVVPGETVECFPLEEISIHHEDLDSFRRRDKLVIVGAVPQDPDHLQALQQILKGRSGE